MAGHILKFALWNGLQDNIKEMTVEHIGCGEISLFNFVDSLLEWFCQTRMKNDNGKNYDIKGDGKEDDLI